MKLNHRRLGAQGVANGTQVSLPVTKAQSRRRQRRGTTPESGEAGQSGDLEDLLVIHHKRPSLRRKSSRRTHDSENPEESPDEQALETGAMTMLAYAHEANSLVVVVSGRERGDQHGGSNHHFQYGANGHSEGRTASKADQRDTARGQVARGIAHVPPEIIARADLSWTQAKLLELAREARFVASASDWHERAITLMQTYLAHCVQRTRDTTPGTTLLEVRKLLLALSHDPEIRAAAGRVPADPVAARALARFNLFLPLWLLQLHRPRLHAHVRQAAARSQAAASLIKRPLA